MLPIPTPKTLESFSEPDILKETWDKKEILSSVSVLGMLS